jgi:hypothetical protein
MPDGPCVPSQRAEPEIDQCDPLDRIDSKPLPPAPLSLGKTKTAPVQRCAGADSAYPKKSRKVLASVPSFSA